MDQTGDGLGEETAMIVASLRSLLEARHVTDRMLLSAPSGPVFDPGLWRELANLGLLAMGAPERLGGAGLGLAVAGAAAGELGAWIAPEPFITCAVAPSAVAAFLPEAAAQKVAAGLRSGDHITACAWPMDPVPPAASQPRLDAAGKLGGDSGLVHHADLAHSLLVLAWRDEVPCLVEVEAGSTGLALHRRRLGDGLGAARLSFERVSNRLLVEGVPALEALAAARLATALCSSAYLVGLARRVLDKTLEHLRIRVQFDRPLGAFQTLQHEAVDLHMELRLAEASWRRAAGLADAVTGAPAQAAVSAAKARSAKVAVQTCKSAIQMFGGLGFAEEAGLGLALRVVLQHAAWHGGRQAHLRRFATLTGLAA